MKYLRVILIVLLLGCCTLWVASYWKIWWLSSDGLLLLHIRNGSFAIGGFEHDMRLPYGLVIHGYADLQTGWWPVVWIYTAQDLWDLHGTFWLPTLLLALPLAISVSPWARRRRRARQGLCIRCGYDLQGTDHEACPECGTKRETAHEQLPDGGSS